MDFPFYDITLPLPPSVNAMHTVGGGYRDPVTKKWKRQVARSDDYKNWIQYANIAWRSQFPWGIRTMFEGRLRVFYFFLWREGTSAALLSDIGNREKCLSDFLEGKFFKNDNQIDEQYQFRRLTKEGENRVMVRVMEIPDRRSAPFLDFFNSKT